MVNLFRIQLHNEMEVNSDSTLDSLDQEVGKIGKYQFIHVRPDATEQMFSVFSFDLYVFDYPICLTRLCLFGAMLVIDVLLCTLSKLGFQSV